MVYSIVTGVMLVASFFIVKKALIRFKRDDDPSEIVIDEVIGCLITFRAIEVLTALQEQSTHSITDLAKVIMLLKKGSALARSESFPEETEDAARNACVLKEIKRNQQVGRLNQALELLRHTDEKEEEE